MFPNIEDEHYKLFADCLSKVIEARGVVNSRGFVARQKQQLEALVGMEQRCREILGSHPWGPAVYSDFIVFIRDQRHNILGARPFFRERQGTFTESISTALKNRDAAALQKFNFNFAFVKFAVGIRPWSKSCDPMGLEFLTLAKNIERLRHEIVETNMPLAIARARLFWRRTHRSQLSYMDLVQIASEGLIAAVDKFVLPYSERFRKVVIGRMVGNFIEEYSETLVHFYPVDRRRIYRANKHIAKYNGHVDFDDLTEIVNKELDGEHQTTAAELSDLLAAASCVSADSVPPDSDVRDSIQRYAADDGTRPDVQVERAEVYAALNNAIPKLTLLEQKLLRLRGVAL